MSPTSSAPGPQEHFDLDANDESLPLLQALVRRHGDTFAVPSVSRPGGGLVINNPDDIRRVLLTNRANYIKGAGLERVRMLLGTGLITSDGEFWTRQRRMVQPVFTGNANRAVMPMVQNLTDGLIERWAAIADTGETIDLTEELSALALDVVLLLLLICSPLPS